MPFLEQFRRTHRAAARRFLTANLRLELLAADLWPALWAACFLGGAALGSAWGSGAPAPWGGPWTARGACLLPGLWHGRRVPAPWVCLAVTLLATLWSAGHAARLQQRPALQWESADEPSRYVGDEGAAVLRLTGYAATVGDAVWSAPARVLAIHRRTGASGPAPTRGEGVLLRCGGPPPPPGTVVAGGLVWRRPAPARVAGGFDDRDYLAGRGLAWRVRADSLRILASPWPGILADRARQGLTGRLEHLLPPRESALAAAVLFGARTPASRVDAAPFADLGLAHLFAVSGLHVGIVAAFLLLPLRAATLSPVGRATLMAVALIAYVALTGGPGSVVRASGAVLLAGLAGAAGRRPQGLRVWGLLFWAVVWWDPARALDTGTRLSFLAAGGILAWHALDRTVARVPRWLRMPVAGVAVSLAAQWATLPLVASAFGRVNAASTLANVVAVPVFGAAVWLVAAALALADLVPAAASWLAALAWLLLRGLAGLVGAAVPVAAAGEVGLPVPELSGSLAWGGLTAGLVTALHRGGRWHLLIPVLLAAGPLLLARSAAPWPPRDGPGVVQFAVGQGDCGLVVFPDGWCGLVDTGQAGWSGPGTAPFAREVAPWLRRHGLDRLDAVFLTHGHRDHTGGASAVADLCDVVAWWGGGRAAARLDPGPTPWRIPTPRAVAHAWRDWDLVVLDPCLLGPEPQHENDASLVLVLRRQGRAVMVWSGDLEHAGEAVLLAADAVPDGATVWKAGHHGSRTAGGAAFLARLAPRLVVVSCGPENRYGHPDHGPYVVQGDTVPVVRTDLEGTVVCNWSADGRVRVHSRHGPARRLDSAGPGF